uniref:palmitoyl-protein hydrolase n=2 Tax=Ascaris TaxID=6251 RepID=A0A9J2PAV4_ASCLU
MLPGIFRSVSTLSSRFIFGLANLCLPGAGNSKANIGYEMATDPVVVPAKGKHTATIIFLHGLGDTGHGWSSVFADEIPIDHVKSICPTAPIIPVTLNMGMRMPAWFDLYGLTPDTQEDEDGIEQSAKIIHSMIDEEVRSGTPADRIIIGGFSMGGALALYAGLTYDKPLAGILGLSSFLVQRSKVPGNHTANSNTPILMGHGGADFMVPIAFGEMTAAFLKKFNPNVLMKTYPSMPHGSCPEELADVRAWLLERLPPI